MSRKESLREKLKKEIEGEKFVTFSIRLKEKEKKELEEKIEKFRRYLLIEHGIKASKTKSLCQLVDIGYKIGVEQKKLVVMDTGEIKVKEEASLEPLLRELRRHRIEIDEENPIVHIINIIKEWKQLKKELEKKDKEIEKLKERIERYRSKETAWDRLERLLKLEFPKEMKDPFIASCIEDEEDFFIVLNRQWDYIPKKIQGWIFGMIFREIGAEWEIKWKRLRIPKDRNEREQLITEYIKGIEEWKKKQREKEVKKYAKPVTPALYSKEELERKLEKKMIMEELEGDPLLRYVIFDEFGYTSIDEVEVEDVVTAKNMIEKEIQRIKNFIRERGGRVHLKEFAKHFISSFDEKLLSELWKRGVIAIIDDYLHLLKG